MLTSLQFTTLLAISRNAHDVLVRASAVHALAREQLVEPKQGVALCDDGAIVWDGGMRPEPFALADFFILTSRGQAYVNALFELPLPQSETRMETVWTVPGTDFEFAESEL
jgi:hypothetical protein